MSIIHKMDLYLRSYFSRIVRSHGFWGLLVPKKTPKPWDPSWLSLRAGGALLGL